MTLRPHEEKDLATLLREAFVAADPEAAWYFDTAEERVVRVAHGATDVPDLPAEEVEGDESRFFEIPALTELDLHAWIEEFVGETADPRVDALLDERHDANRRFLVRLAKELPERFAAWKSFHARHVDDALAAWRREIGA